MVLSCAARHSHSATTARLNFLWFRGRSLLHSCRARETSAAGSSCCRISYRAMHAATCSEAHLKIHICKLCWSQQHDMMCHDVRELVDGVNSLRERAMINPFRCSTGRRAPADMFSSDVMWSSGVLP